MAKSTTTKSKKLLQRRTKLEKLLLAALIALILFILLASHYQWWPFSSQYGGNGLGSAFYTATIPSDESTTSGASTAATGTSANTASSGSNGSNGSNGSSGSNGSGSGSTTTPPDTSSILNFSAGVNTGDSKDTISGQASGLDEHCALLVTSSTVGKQEVCTYTEGDKVVTVTYLNDHVVSASRSGF